MKRILPGGSNYTARSDYASDVYNQIKEMYGDDACTVRLEKLTNGSDCVEVHFDRPYTSEDADNFQQVLKSQGLRDKISTFRHSNDSSPQGWMYVIVKHSYTSPRSEVHASEKFDDFGINKFQIDDNNIDIGLLNYLHDTLVNYLNSYNVPLSDCTIRGYYGVSSHSDEFIVTMPRSYHVAYIGDKYPSADEWGELSRECIDAGLKRAEDENARFNK